MEGNGSIAFRVFGTPITQGSMKFIGAGKPMIHSNKKLLPWRNAVGLEAKQTWEGEPVTGPVVLHCLFKLQRPKSHYGHGGNSMKLIPSAPARHRQKPDADKLLRAIEDALTGIIYKDDSQVDEVHATKRWADVGEAPGVVIIIDTEPAERSESCQQE